MIEWIKKLSHIYTMEYHAAIKKDEFMSFASTWMNFETIILSKLRQEQKTKHGILSLIGEYFIFNVVHETWQKIYFSIPSFL